MFEQALAPRAIPSAGVVCHTVVYGENGLRHAYHYPIGMVGSPRTAMGDHVVWICLHCGMHASEGVAPRPPQLRRSDA